MSTQCLPRYAFALMLTIPCAAFGAEQRHEHNSLGAYVPSNVWLYVASARDPKRSYVEGCWAEVWNEFTKCGIGDAVRDLISESIQDADRDDFVASWNKITLCCSAVHWEELFGQEAVFAERFTNLVPDFFLLARPKPNVVEANYAALSKLLDALAVLCDNTPVTEEMVQGAAVRALEFPNAPVGFYLVRRGGVIGVFMGRPAMLDVVNLMAGKSESSPIVTSPRYLAALKQVAPSTYGTTYLDLDQLFSYLRKFPELSMGPHTQHEGAMTAKKVFARIIDEADIFDYTIATAHMDADGVRESYDSYTKLKSDANTKALYRALASQNQFESFEKYVPVDASGYSVTTGIKFSELYALAADIVKTEVPDGDQYWSDWEKMLTDFGFEPHEDLLSWLSGECISVSVPAARVSPFGATCDNVMLIRVSDATKAAAKLDAFITWLNDKTTSLMGQSLMIQPATLIPAEGFRSVTLPSFAAFLNPYVGVWDNWLVVATSERAVTKVMNTKAGHSPSIKTNPRFRSEAVSIDGPVCSASFIDLTHHGQDMAQAFSMMQTMFGMFLPKDPATRPARAVFAVIGRLASVVGRIDFLSSKSFVSTFDNGWRSKYVVTYKPPKEASAGSTTDR